MATWPVCKSGPGGHCESWHAPCYLVVEYKAIPNLPDGPDSNLRDGEDETFGKVVDGVKVSTDESYSVPDFKVHCKVAVSSVELEPTDTPGAENLPILVTDSPIKSGHSGSMRCSNIDVHS